MNKATELYYSFGTALQTRRGLRANTKQCVEVFIKEMEKLADEFKDPSKMAITLQEIRKDLQEL